MKLHNGHRGNRPDVVRIENREQSFSDFRKFIVNFQMDAGSQERGGFNQAFDMGILAPSRLEQQTGGNFRVFLREVGAHLTQVG